MNPGLILISLAHSSIFGGQLLSLCGSGFGDDPSQLSIAFGGQPCEVASVMDEVVHCVTSSATRTHQVNNNA